MAARIEDSQLRCRCRCLLLALLALALLVPPAALLAGETWTPAEPGYAWQFPADHWAHPRTRNEWWYLTGHLETKTVPVRRFGVQFTFFRVGLLPSPPAHSSPAWRTSALVMGHAAISDLGRQDHRFSELVYRAVPALGGFPEYPEPVLAWSVAPPGTEGRWEIRWNGKGFDLSARDSRRGFAFSLTTEPEKPLVFQGPGGLSQKSPDGAVHSLYYSFTRLATRGTVEIDGETFPVEGLSWFDKEFGSGELGEDQAGWDWLSLQLGDGRELMLYLLRRRGGTLSLGRGTLVAADGEVRYLTPEDWKVGTEGSWSSPENQAVYPSVFRVEVPSEKLSLRVTPAFADQENRSRILEHMAYWEGVVEVTSPAGEDLGRGFVELTGYGQSRRPSR